MGKYWFLPLLFSLALLFGEEPANSHSLTPPDISAILSRGKLRVGLITYETPPFVMTSPAGELTGIDIEIAKSLAKELGVEVEFIRKANSGGALVNMVMNREADIGLTELSYTPSRAEKVLFSNTYVKMNQCLLIERSLLTQVPNGEPLFVFLNKPQTRVGYLFRSAIQEWAAELLPHATRIAYESWEKMMDALVSNQISIAVVHEPMADSFGITYPQFLLKYETIKIADRLDNICIAIPWNDYSLQEWVNRYLAINYPSLKLTDVLKQYRSYFAEPVPTPLFPE